MSAQSTEERIDIYPTHHIGGYRVRIGRPFPFGATLTGGGVNFSVYSSAATAMSLVLFRRGAAEPEAEVPFPPEFRIGSVFCMIVFGLDYESIEYGFRADGPFEPERGLRFDGSRVLSDPYARLISGRDVWGAPPDWSDPYPYRARHPAGRLRLGRRRSAPHPDRGPDHLRDARPRLHLAPLVGGRPRRGPSPGSGRRSRTCASSGSTASSCMPIFEFDEFSNINVNPETGEPLRNYWGYSTVAFFAPKSGYAATGAFGMQADELKTLVRELHKAGIEIILDVVFNHTAEGDERGPTISFRGLDNTAYYMLTPFGQYLQFQRDREHGQLQSSGSPRFRARAACVTGQPSTTSTASASTWPLSWTGPRTGPRCLTLRCWSSWPSTRCCATAS